MKQLTTNAIEVVKKQEPLFTVDENAKSCSHSVNKYENSQKTKNISTIWPLAYAQNTWPTTPQILAQQCPLLHYSP